MSADEKKQNDQEERSSKRLRDPHRGPGIEEGPRGHAEGEELRPAKKYAHHIVDTVHDALLVLRKDLRIEAANGAFYETFQTSPEETLGRSVFEFMDRQWDTARLRELLEEILPEDKELEDFEIEQHFERLGHRILLLNARRLDELELILLAIEDVTKERKALHELEALTEELEERVKERTGQVKGLAAALAEAEEKERERIAGVLHDHIQQLLYGAELSLRAIRRRTDELPYEELKQELQEDLGHLEEALDEAQEAARTLSAELSPPIARGEDLEVALEWLAGHFEGRYGLPVELRLSEDFHLPDESMRRLLFQLVRELLFNAVKHAEAPKAYVEGRRQQGGRLLLYVHDEGKGFDKERALKERPEGRGLRAMQNRLELLGGDMHIDTAPGEGTRVTIGVPLDAA